MPKTMTTSSLDAEFRSLMRPRPIRVDFHYSPRGGSVRDIAATPGGRPMGYFQSPKAGGSMAWNTSVQRARYYQCEADPDVSAWMAQPFRMDFHLPAGVRSFHPDLTVNRRSGRSEIEVLVPSSSLAVAQMALVDLARAECNARGLRFVVRQASEILGTVAERNAILVAMDRFTRLDAADVERAEAFFAAMGGEAPYARVVDGLGGPGIGRARLHLLLMRGHLDLDLAKPIRPASRVAWRNGGGGVR